MITVDTADLDPDPASILDLLEEEECDLKAWLQVAVEHWRIGQLTAADKVAKAAVKCGQSCGQDFFNPEHFKLLPCSRKVQSK